MPTVPRKDDSSDLIVENNDHKSYPRPSTHPSDNITGNDKKTQPSDHGLISGQTKTLRLVQSDVDENGVRLRF